MRRLDLLKTAATEVVWTKGGMPFRTPYAVFRLGGTLSFTRRGFLAVSDLARSLQQNSPSIRRGCRFENLRDFLAQVVMRQFGDRIEQGPNVSEQDLAKVVEVVEDWFVRAAVTQTHVVPCAIVPHPAISFQVGPVQFMHASSFRPTDLGIKSGFAVEDAWGRIKRQLSEHAASWIAIVEVRGCESGRSEEVADTIVDIALGALQVVVGPSLARLMARVTARKNPAYRGGLVVSESTIRMTARNMEAGRLLPPEELQTTLSVSRELVDSFGRRVAASLGGDSALPKLEQAWCDGTYWFHEALAEPMATVAVAKLETAMESLLAPGSARASRDRIGKALEVFVGTDYDWNGERGEVEFARRVVTARSRVLHGTRSTTTDDPGIDRRSVEEVTRRMLQAYSPLLDAYLRDTSVEVRDDIEHFLAWIDRAGAIV